MKRFKLAIFKLRHRIKPDLALERGKFVQWLNLLPDSHRFSWTDQDPVSQFMRATTGKRHITVGLDWYSYEQPKQRAMKDLTPISSNITELKCQDGTTLRVGPTYTYADLWEKPLTEVSALPKWASGLMWDKSIDAKNRGFTKADIFKARKDLVG